MADLKPAYLVSGEDDAKIDAWRLRLRRRADEERGPGGLETFDAGSDSPEAVIAALATLSFDTSTRYLLVDGVQAWKAGELKPLIAALKDIPPATVLVLVARGKAPGPLAKAVEGAGGEVRDYPGVKPWHLPKWAIERAREDGVELEAEAAKQLVSLNGGNQQRLAREIEKLVIAVYPSRVIGVEGVELIASGDATPGAYELADALAVSDLPGSLALAEGIVANELAPGQLVWRLAGRLRELHRATALLEAGVSEQEAGAAVARQPWLAKKIIARAKDSDRATLERTIRSLATLEVDLRGGGKMALDETTALDLALTRAISP